MNERPSLSSALEESIFRNYYYLKEELVDFCRQYDLQATGSKAELTERIALFLRTGEKSVTRHTSRAQVKKEAIQLDSLIESPFVCSEQHRAFFKEQLGPSFSFYVPFQKWLKTHGGHTYQESLEAYKQILAEKKNKTSKIDKQFEYNTYIRDFFADNKGKDLKSAITCWNYKKSQPGHNKYEKDDLKVLDE